jgi:hypothetical protein
MSKVARAQSVEANLIRLEKKHHSLEEQVQQLDGQLYLTANEQYQMMKLKRQKLAAKDAIVGIRRLV